MIEKLNSIPSLKQGQEQGRLGQERVALAASLPPIA